MLEAYELIRTEKLEDVKGEGFVYRHKKTGARIAVVKNGDDNKVFYIGFRTPPKDSTGVAHIVEHTVLCGSEKYPAKDPFVELAKGSLNTFLNAMTYPDKTVYPVASANDRDFMNLISVYMDAVFNPNIYREKKIFMQEGWHYEMEDKDGPLTINGVVYNEMKGAYSSPDDLLYREIQKSLLPDTTYGFDSGGDPEEIPELSYEEYIEFHRTYYHPSNSYIYLYGDMDFEEKLKWMDEEYLGKYDKLTVDSSIGCQPEFKEIKRVPGSYPVSLEDSTENKSFLSLNLRIDDGVDKEHALAFPMLEYVLLTSPAAPLKKALLDAGFGDDVFGGYDGGIMSTYFSITVKNADENRADEFMDVIMEVLERLRKEGLDKKALLAALNSFEFRYFEGDYGRTPKGLVCGLSMLEGWLYDEEEVFTFLKQSEVYDSIRKKLSSGYFEELIEKYFLKNKNGTLLIMKPEKGLTLKKEKELEEKLSRYKDSLNDEEIEGLIRDTKQLWEYQETEDSREILKMIPRLKREDLDRKMPPYYNEEIETAGKKLIFHRLMTNGIGYLRICFPVDELMGYAPYLSLLDTVLGYMDCEHYSLMEISNEMDIYTGGVNTDLLIYAKQGDCHKMGAYFQISSSFFYKNIKKALELMKETAIYTHIWDEKRLKEIITETRTRIQMHLPSSGNSVAANRISSYFSEVAQAGEYVSGREYYHFLLDMEENFEEKKEELIELLKRLTGEIFSREDYIISYAAQEEGLRALRDNFEEFIITGEEKERLRGREELEKKSLPKTEKKNEGFKTSGQVQFVARGACYKDLGYDYKGSMQVLKNILDYDYLWNNVRVKQGAYGCSCQFVPDGRGLFISYRDPGLSETDEIYKNAWKFLERFEADEDEMTKYLIGTVSDMVSARTPRTKAYRSFRFYLSQIPLEKKEREWEEMMETSCEDIRGFAPLVREIAQAGYFCAVGNEDRIDENKGMFLNTERLI